MEFELALTFELFMAIRAYGLSIASINWVIVNYDFFVRVDGVHKVLRDVILFRGKLACLTVSFIEKRRRHRFLVLVKLINHCLLDLMGVVLALITLCENWHIAYSDGFMFPQRAEIEIFELKDFMQSCHLGLTR